MPYSLGVKRGGRTSDGIWRRRRGVAALMGLVQSLETLGADRVYIDPAALRSATSFDQSKNSNKSKKNLIDGVMSSSHIR